MQGKTIAHYKILEKLGEGGMGVVYQAEDTRLRRIVALKFLSGGALTSEDSKSRFLHEAQAAASLDHPNICGIYEIGEAEGRLFMAMPFIEGEGLDKRIAQGPRPVAETLEIAIQTAEALEEAHGKRVVHRDIKPSNIMLQDRGRGRLHCVLMDFGLARLQHATKLTREGTQLGTAAYMSPEQVQGTAADQRCDIWALGVVVYEMAVGRTPFAAEYEQALFYGILNEQAEPMTSLRTGLPMELERITNKCLAKNPGERYQNCTDLLVDLHALKKMQEGSAQRPASGVAQAGSGARASFAPPAAGAEDGGASAVAPEVASTPTPRVARRFSLLVVVAVGILGAALAAVVTTLATNNGARVANLSEQYTLRRITWDGELSIYPALSADGSLLAYSSDRAGQGNLDIWVQQVDGGSLLRVTDDPADELQADFSPDGTKIAFNRFGQGILIVPSLGGDAFLVAADAQSPKFSPDSQKIAYFQGGKLYVSSVSMGNPVELLAEAGLRLASPPLWTPDGKHLVFVGSLDGGAEDWWAVPAESGPPQSMHAAEQFAKLGLTLQGSEGWDWSGSHIVTYHDSEADLYRVPVDLESLQVTAPPERLTFGSGVEFAPAGSTGGKIAFSDVRQDRNIVSLKLDPRTGAAIGELEELTSAESSDTGPDIVHDRLVFMSNRWGSRDLWTKDLASGREANLTNDTAEQWQPVLSADGERVAYLIYEEGRQAIYVRPFTGGVGRLLCADCGQPRSWSPDGRFLLYERGEPDAIHALEVETGKQTKILSMEGAPVDGARFSPDGAWIVFQVSGGEAGLFVAPFHRDQPVARPEWIEAVRDGSAALPTWGFDGNTVYFTSGRLGSPDIWMQRLEAATKQSRGEPQLVRRFPFMRHSIAMMAPNQQRLAATRDRLVFPLSELGGSVWLMEPRPQEPSR